MGGEEFCESLVITLPQFPWWGGDDDEDGDGDDDPAGTDVDDHYNGYDDYEDNCAEDKIIMVILLKSKW